MWAEAGSWHSTPSSSGRYLALANTEFAKRDLSAILRADPDHQEAMKLHRGVKKFAKAVDGGSGFVESRQWSRAVEKFEAALDALTPAVHSAPLCAGMCTAHLKMRKAEPAVTWCERASAADDTNREHLFAYADARVLAGEDHAAVQV